MMLGRIFVEDISLRFERATASTPLYMPLFMLTLLVASGVYRQGRGEGGGAEAPSLEGSIVWHSSKCVSVYNETE